MSTFRILLALLLTLGLAAPTFAHAALVTSDPAPNAVVATAPTQFTLHFNEPVSPLVLTLAAPDGSVTPLSGATEADSVLIPAPPNLETGTFVLSYRVISVDGHPVGGTVGFSIGAAGGKAPNLANAVDWSLLVPIWATKVLLYAGLFLGVGGSFFRRWLASGSQAGQGAGTTALVLGLVAALLSIALQGLDGLNRPLVELLRPQIWAAGAATSLGLSAGLAAATMILALLADRTAGHAGRAIALLALLGTGLSLAVTGHASAAEPQWLTRPAVMVHAIGIVFWAGALLPLHALLKSGAPEATTALRRFSFAIPIVLFALLTAGATLALVQLGRPSAFFETAYGRILLAKLALVAALLVLGAINRWRLTDQSETPNSTARRQLLRLIAIETMLVLAVFCVVALWRFTPPPRALAAASPIVVSLAAADVMGEISFATDGTADIMLMQGSTPLVAQSVSVSLSNPASGIEAMIYPAQSTAVGTWQVPNLLVPTGGQWDVQLDIRISDFQMTHLSGKVSLPR